MPGTTERPVSAADTGRSPAPSKRSWARSDRPSYLPYTPHSYRSVVVCWWCRWTWCSRWRCSETTTTGPARSLADGIPDRRLQSSSGPWWSPLQSHSLPTQTSLSTHRTRQRTRRRLRGRGVVEPLLGVNSFLLRFCVLGWLDVCMHVDIYMWCVCVFKTICLWWNEENGVGLFYLVKVGIWFGLSVVSIMSYGQCFRNETSKWIEQSFWKL